MHDVLNTLVLHVRDQRQPAEGEAVNLYAAS